MIKSELCRIDLRCMLFGAAVMLLTGLLSAVSAGSFDLFDEICRPKLTPPAAVFPIVWIFLYFIIGAAAGAVACAKEKALDGCRLRGLLLFVIMTVFNFIWAPLFFGARAFFAAFIAIVMMIILTVAVTVCFSKIYRVAAAATVIYLLWLLFAAYLNLAVIILN